MKRFMIVLCVVAVVGLTSAAVQASITVTSGNTTVPGDSEYGNVRYRSLNNGGGTSGGEIYIGKGDLGDPNRSEISFNWNLGTTPTLFEYDPTTGIEKATASLTAGNVFTSWGSGGVLPNTGAPIYPLAGKPVNYILLSLYERNPLTPYTFHITDLEGQDLGTFSSLNGVNEQWTITDPTLLADGFKVYGDLTLTGTGNGQETDRVGMAFGWTSTVSAVPEPATIIIWSLLGMGSWLGMRVVRRRRGGPVGRQP